MRDKILELKRAKNAVILAHYYVPGEVQDVADFVGDSLALSQQAAKTDADIIVFAGVHFMGETAKVLSPAKKVLLPDPKAGCSLAASCPEDAFRAFRAQYPDHIVVSYVNTTVAIKKLTDICCTSSNALRVIESIPHERGIIFAPDRNLGAWLREKTGRDNMVLWDGACHVHDGFGGDSLALLKKEHPAAKVAAHPECRAEVLAQADYVGSTSGILRFVGETEASEYIIATEPGIFHEICKLHPSKHLLPACACNECEYMKMNTLQKVYDCLLHETGEVLIPESDRVQALGSIERMMKC